MILNPMEFNTKRLMRQPVTPHKGRVRSSTREENHKKDLSSKIERHKWPGIIVKDVNETIGKGVITTKVLFQKAI